MHIPRAKHNVFLDADGVVVAFEKGAILAGLPPQEFKLQPGAYLFLQPYHLAAEALTYLEQADRDNRVRVWIATKPPSDNPYAYVEKVLWFRHHFPWLADRIIVLHDKSQLGSSDDALIDDRPHKANVEHFRGEVFVLDPNDPETAWNALLDWVESKPITGK